MPTLADNKRAKFDYEILEKFEAGLELFGHEVKSARKKRVSLAGSRVLIRGGEVFAVGVGIQPYQAGNIPENYEEQRTIKLFLRKKEIDYLSGKLNQKGLTIVPLSLYTKGRLIKMGIGLVKGKKKSDKREKIKKKEDKIKIERLIKNRR